MYKSLETFVDMYIYMIYWLREAILKLQIPNFLWPLAISTLKCGLLVYQALP